MSGGIWFLHEEKSKREMTYIVIGLIFIIGGSILTGLPSKIRKEGSWSFWSGAFFDILKAGET